MAKDARYSVKFRRRREGKTDYRKRLKLLKSNKTRLVVRKTNKYIIAQLVDYNPKGDLTKIFVTSKDLKKYGYDLPSFKNTLAAYLTGYLIGKLALKRGIKEAILDIGRNIHRKGIKLYAVLKGAIDAGMEIPHGDVFPNEDRIRGKHIANYLKIIRGKDTWHMSKYVKNNIDENKILNTLEKVKSNIDKE